MRRSESPSQGYRLTAASLPCPIRSKGTYGRGDRRRTRGTVVEEGFRSWHKIPPRRACERGSITLIPSAPQGSTPARRRELFSLRKKRPAGIKLSAWQEAGSLYRLNHPFSALKNPLKIMGIQWESLPDAPPAAHLRIRRSRIPKCVVKQRTAETRGQSPRGLPAVICSLSCVSLPPCGRRGQFFTGGYGYG